MTEPLVDDHPFDFGLLSDDTFDTRDEYGPPEPGCHMGWCPVCIPFDGFIPSDEQCTCGTARFGERGPYLCSPRALFALGPKHRET